MAKLNQKGIAHLFLLLILVIGIIGGVYLVKHPAIFKPKAYETNPPIDQYDTPPESLITTSLGAQNLLKDAGRAADYSITYNQTDDGVEIEFEPQELTEDEAKIILNNTDIYYLKMLSRLLLDTFSTTPQPIDPRYTLCDYLDPSVLDKMGAEPTFLDGGRELQCSDSPPAKNEFPDYDPHKRFLYQKVSSKVLVKMIETARLVRENKDFFEHVKDVSPLFIPIIGPIVTPTINAIRTPGADPFEVANETLIWTIIQTLGGQAIKVGIETAPEVGRVAWGIIGPAFKDRAMTIYIKEGAQETFYTGGEIAGKILQRLRGGQKLLVKLAGALPDRVVASSSEKFMIDNTLLPLIQAGKAYVLSPNVTKPVLTKLLDALEQWEGGTLVSRLGSLPRNDILQTIENHWVVVVKDKDFFKLGSGLWKSAGFEPDRLVILKESAVSESTMAHAFTHVISDNVKSWLTDEFFFTLNPEQAKIYGSVLSQMYELSTDIVVEDLFGYTSGGYKAAFPKLALAMDRLTKNIIQASNGHLTRTDFMEYALTKSSSRLMKKISESMTIEEFMALINNQLDTIKLVEVLKVRATFAQEFFGKLLTQVQPGTVPTTASTGIYLMQDYFATRAQGEQLPADSIIIPITPEEDIDISLPNHDEITPTPDYSKLCCPPGSGTTFQDCKRPGVDTTKQCCHADEWFTFYMVDKTAEACHQ